MCHCNRTRHATDRNFANVFQALEIDEAHLVVAHGSDKYVVVAPRVVTVVWNADRQILNHATGSDIDDVDAVATTNRYTDVRAVSSRSALIRQAAQLYGLDDLIAHGVNHQQLLFGFNRGVKPSTVGRNGSTVRSLASLNLLSFESP